MRRFGTVATVSLVGGLLLASPALAAKPTKHHVTLKTKEADIFVTPGPGGPQGPPSALTAVGVVSGTLGTGLDRVDARPLAGTGAFEFFSRRGSFHGPIVFKDTPGPTGVTVAGTITISGGAGRYAHVHGSLHIAAFVDFMAHYTTATLTGTLTY